MPKQTSILETLPVDAQHRILGWLEIHPDGKVVELVAEPPPNSYGINTHITTLRRFYARHRAETRAENAELAGLFAPGSANPLESAPGSLISEWAFQIATDPRRKIGAFKALSYWLLKQREHDQREKEIAILLKRLDFDREKFEFNVARRAILLHVEIAGIVADRKLDSEGKIRAARDLFFGAPQQGVTAQEQSPQEQSPQQQSKDPAASGPAAQPDSNSNSNSNPNPQNL